MSNVCEHGSLARSCEVCELKAELAEARKACDEAIATQNSNAMAAIETEGALTEELAEARSRVLDRAEVAKANQKLHTENDRLREALASIADRLNTANREHCIGCYQIDVISLPVFQRSIDLLRDKISELRIAQGNLKAELAEAREELRVFLGHGNAECMFDKCVEARKDAARLDWLQDNMRGYQFDGLPMGEGFRDALDAAMIEGGAE